jgi:hypothetical protein
MSFQVVAVVGFAVFMDYLVYELIIPLTPYSPAGVEGGAELALLSAAYVGCSFSTVLLSRR